MTLSYMKNLTPAQIAEVIEQIDGIMVEGKEVFLAEFPLEAWYGPHHTVRALEPSYNMEWPSWLMLLVAMKPEWRDTTYKWYPHVATKTDKELKVNVIAVSVMCKKTEVARWDLT